MNQITEEQFTEEQACAPLTRVEFEEGVYHIISTCLVPPANEQEEKLAEELGIFVIRMKMIDKLFCGTNQKPPHDNTRNAKLVAIAECAADLSDALKSLTENNFIYDLINLREQLMVGFSKQNRSQFQKLPRRLQR